jgi:spore coat protein U-like protein
MRVATLVNIFFAMASAAVAPVHAATATSQFQVSMTLQAECKLTSASDLAFGTSGVIQAAINATSAIGVQCTNTTPYNVGLSAGAGSGATVALRKMTASSGATVNYQLFRDSGRSQTWGDQVGTNTASGTGNGAVQTMTVYGTVPAQTTPAAGAYTDTVQVTVTY